MHHDSTCAEAGAIEVVVPCFNEEKRLPIEAFAAWIGARRGWHFRFVDDGSTDGTAAAVRRLVGRVGAGNASLLSLPSNRGKAEAVRQGLLASIGSGAEFVGFCDADLATPLDDLTRLFDAMRQAPHLEMAMGSRVQMLGNSVQRRAVRHFAARAIANLAALALDLPVHDTQCGAKAMRNGPSLRDALSRPFGSGWVFDMELIQRIAIHARDRGIADPASVFLEVPVSAWRDVEGSKVRLLDACLSAASIWGIYRARVRHERGWRRSKAAKASLPALSALPAPQRVVEIDAAPEGSPVAVPSAGQGEAMRTAVTRGRDDAAR